MSSGHVSPGGDLFAVLAEMEAEVFETALQSDVDVAVVVVNPDKICFYITFTIFTIHFFSSISSGTSIMITMFYLISLVAKLVEVDTA